MIIFQVIFIVILLIFIAMGFAVKYNYEGLQDRLITIISTIDMEDYIRNQFPNRWIIQLLFLLVLFLLSI